MKVQVASLIVTALMTATTAYAQSPMDHSQMKGMDMSKPGAMKMDQKSAAMKVDQSAQVSMTEGEVRKLDKEQGKVTLKHGDIANLGMPGMTMVFKVSEKAMLDQVKEGDKVRFAADMINNQLTVTKIEQAQ